MSEYIVKETGYPGAIKQEIVGELVRCKYCIHHKTGIYAMLKDGTEIEKDVCVLHRFETTEDYFCGSGKENEDHAKQSKEK